jgi:hypothetical protein
MNNALVALQQQAVTLVDDENTRAIANSLSGGLTGGFGNRISLKGNRFRFIVNGTDVGVRRENYLDVAILAANPHVSRIYYAKQYDMNAKPEAPDCYSLDGKVPPLDVPNRQSDKCATCPQNVKGSAIRGDSKAKACAYKKRVIVAAPDSIDGDIFALDVNALSLFGTDQPTQNMYNLKSYIETLTAHQMLAVKLVTRLTFDDSSSVPKLFFSPIRMLTTAEWEQAKVRMSEETIQAMLSDVINEAETGDIVPEAVRQQPIPQTAPGQPIPASQQPAAAPVAPTQPATPAPAAAAPQMPPLPRPRGRPTKAPADAAPPAQQAASPAPNGNGNATGFAAGMQPTQQAAAPAQAAPATTEGAPKAKGFTIDLEDFDA